MHYSEYLLQKESDLSTKKQRKKQRDQMADILKYLGGDKHWYKRTEIQRELQETYSSDSEFNLGQLAADIPYTDISVDDICLNFSTGEDYDGYPEYRIELAVSTPELDFEYYDTLCSYILPSDYQIKLALQEREEYNTYLKLKDKYEQGGVNAS
jgi:hypothetical protein